MNLMVQPIRNFTDPEISPSQKNPDWIQFHQQLELGLVPSSVGSVVPGVVAMADPHSDS